MEHGGRRELEIAPKVSAAPQKVEAGRVIGGVPHDAPNFSRYFNEFSAGLGFKDCLLSQRAE